MRALKFIALATLLTSLSPIANAEPGSMIPPDSRIASAPAGTQRLLLSPLDPGAVQNQGKYHLESTDVSVYPDLEPKAGLAVLKFSARAGIGGAKGDFSITDVIPGDLQELGMWVYLTPESNVSKVGFQVIDSEGESLIALVPADWEGWKWVELNLIDAPFVSAYKQDGKTGQAETPIKSVHIVWFTQSPGPTSLGVDALLAVSKLEKPAKPYRIESISPPWGEAGEALQGQVLIHNYTDKALDFKIKATLQTNGNYHSPEVPDPVHGRDHAQGQPSWLEFDGERIENNSMTDHDDSSHLTPQMPKAGLSEIFQVVDLGEARKITRIGWRAGDANWVNKMDVSVSDDGATFTPVESLQNVELYKKWGDQTKDLPQPASGRYVRVRYHNSGENLLQNFRSLSALYLFDGVADESREIPAVGTEVFAESQEAQVPAKSFQVATFKPTKPLGPDAYLLAVEVESAGNTELTLSDYFVMPKEDIKLRPESRFGINVGKASNVPLLARAGFGWVRFENMKWRFYNPNPGDFRFDGTVQPWMIPFDDYYTTFREAGMSILPYIFQTPDWASSAPEGTEKNVGGYPPKDPNDYAKAIFQAVARFGSSKVPEDELLTSDRLSGLNLVNTYELWNEQNLNAPAWGFFVGPLSEYYPMFRLAAEQAKKADPNALVTNGGWAGLSMEWVDTMRTFKYPDGKTPLDFTDVLNVHFYSGKDDPEYTTKDPNAFRGDAKPEDIQTLEDDLIDLADWRDELKPGMPIWVTETGNDVGGPMGLTERHQAAKLTRGNMLSFANGIEKVFIYRESGSNPAQHAGAGLLRNDLSLRPSFFTVANQTRQLEGAMETRVPRLRTEDPDVWMYYWNRPQGGVLTAWAPNENSKLGLDLGKCLVTNAFGGETEMEVTKDFPLGMFPVYISKIGNMAVVEKLQAEAAQREEARKKKLAADRGAEAWLFDFGSTEYIGTKKVGGIRPFTPVMIENTYDPAKGFGFESQGSGKDSTTAWRRGPLEKDAIEFRQPAAFKLDAKPGKYTLEFKGRGYPEGAELLVAGAKEGDLAIPLPEGKDGAPTAPVNLTVVAGQPLDIQIPPGAAQWLTIIENVQP